MKRAVLISAALAAILAVSAFGAVELFSKNKDRVDIAAPSSDADFAKSNFSDWSKFASDKRPLTREQFIVAASRVFSADGLKPFEALAPDIYPKEIREHPSKSSVMYFTFIQSEKKPLYSRVFGNDYDLKKNISKNEAIPLLFYAFEQEKSKFGIVPAQGAKEPQSANVSFKKELSGLAGYSGFSASWGKRKIDGGEGVSFEELYAFAQPLAAKIVADRQAPAPESAIVKMPLSTSASTQVQFHDHSIVNDPFYIDKHALLHALINYEAKHKSIPLKESPVPALGEDLLALMKEQKLNPSEFKVLDTGAFYPDFLTDKFEGDTAIVHPEKRVLYFVKGYQAANGTMQH